MYQSLLSLTNMWHALVSHISIFVAFDIYLARVSLCIFSVTPPPHTHTHTSPRNEVQWRVGGYEIIGITITI